MRKIGMHLSTSGGLVNAVREGVKLGVDAVQLFLKNPSRWVYRDYTQEEIDIFRKERDESGIEIFAHSGYLINLSGSGSNLEKSIACAADEMKRASQLGIEYIVFHPGSCADGTDAGIKNAAESINRLFDKNDLPVKILLETTAGQGNSIGHDFSSISGIIDKTEHADKILVCLDTCHVHAAGYSISDSEGVKKTVDEFDRIIGLEKLKLIHLNDSKREAGSFIDRHEHIGHGTIGIGGMTALITDRRISGVTLILETPDKGLESADKVNLEIVRKIAEGVKI